MADAPSNREHDEHFPMQDREFDEPASRSLAGDPDAPLKLRHPAGLRILFVTEMWERFSFYGMKAFLILFMTLGVSTGALGWSIERAGQVYGWYTGLVYLTPIIGGYLADRYLGTHRSMVIGGIIIAAGHFTLAGMDAFEVGSNKMIVTFIAGLGLIVIGTGFFKPCVSVMVGQLYGERDPRRDAGFTIFYMGINLGAFLGPIICGGLRFARQTPDGVYGWSWAFGAAGVGMVLGLIAYFIGRPFALKGIGLRPRSADRQEVIRDEGPFCGECGYSLKGHPTDAVCPECGKRAGRIKRGGLTRHDKESILAILILAFFVIFFWTAFEQAGGSMNLFAEHRTDRSLSPDFATWLYHFANEPGYAIPWWVLTLAGAGLLACWVGAEFVWKVTERSRIAAALSGLLGLAGGSIALIVGVLKGTGFLGELFPPALLTDPQYPTEWFQSVNPLFILMLAPIFAAAWVWLGRRGLEPSTPVKFSMGLILLGCGFTFMVLGAQASSAGDAIVPVSGWWLTGAFFIHTCGELCLSPVGLSAVTKLAPVKFVSLLMGVWFLANFISNLLAGFLTGYSEQIAESGFILDGLAGFFLIFVIAPIAAGIVMLAITPWLKSLMHGRA